MAERMNFVSRRGRTADGQKNLWLKNERAERAGEWMPFTCVVNGWAMYVARTERQAKIIGLSVINELRSRVAHKNDRLTAEVYDRATMIKLWEAER